MTVVDGGSDEDGGAVVALGKDSVKRSFSMSDKKNVSLEIVCTDEVRIVFNSSYPSEPL